MPNYLVPDGIWSWHITPRAWYSAALDATYFGYVDADTQGLWIGKIDHAVSPAVVTSYRINDSRQLDDHNNLCVLPLASGKILVCWTGHDGIGVQFRTSTSAGSIEAWEAVVSVTDVGYTKYGYGSLAQLSAEATGVGGTGRIYCYYRLGDSVDGQNLWHYRYSDDDGATWSTRVILYDAGSGLPYFEFNSNGVDRVDITAQNGQVSIGANIPLYHFYQHFTGGSTFFKTTDGTDITASLPFSSITTFTKVNTGSETIKNWAVSRDGSGNPVAACVYLPGVDFSYHSYRMPRWNGSAWTKQSVEIASGGEVEPHYITVGSSIQEHYSGGISVNPANANEVVLSRRITGDQWAVQLYATSDGGDTWTRTEEITSGGVVKNCRPTWVLGDANPPIKVIYWQGRPGSTNGGYTVFQTYSTNLQSWPLLQPTIIARDEFARFAVGTVIVATAGDENYSPPVGQRWTGSSTTAIVSTARRCYCTSSGNIMARMTGATPKTANYRVECDIYTLSTLAGSGIGVIARQSDSVDTAYTLIALTSTLKLTLTRRVAAASVTLINTFAITLDVASTHAIAMEVEGTGDTVTIRCYWDGALAYTYLDTDANRIVAVGRPGMRFSTTNGTDSAGMHIDNFVATDLAAGGRPLINAGLLDRGLVNSGLVG